MKLQGQEIIDILKSKGFTSTNINEYQNLDTILHLECKNGHHIDASIKTVRNAHFKCPICEGTESISDKVDDLRPPEKKGYRLIAIDNATEKMGISIYDDGKLVFYHLFTITGETITRIIKNNKLLEEVFINQWHPDIVVFEDIQYQNNVVTFKVLAMLLGTSLVIARKNNIKYETVTSSAWRSHFMIPNKGRDAQKLAAINKVKNMYNIEVNDDVAEAILLGKYSVDSLRKEEIKKLF